MSTVKKAMSGIVGLVAAVGLTAGPASARPFDQGTFDDVENYSVDCGTLVVDVTQESVGRFVARQDQNGEPLYLTVLTQTQWRTNPATGKTMLVVIKGLYSKDQSVVDNGDGTRLITDISPSRVVYYAPDGSVAGSASGLQTFSFLLDSDDNFLGLVSISFVGHDTLPGFCEIAEQLLT